MAVMTSLGQMANDFAKLIYKHQRNIVNSMVKSGKIKPEQADSEFAKRVSEELLKHSMNVPEWIIRQLK